ncbi:MAG: T9SS type A sorting domain-containing protein [Candidatus Marinimicrobia bacterium]|nr:T9SS type A sorting domain-containing protein [Candidatus Neomarinimicrobiota bacterium]
MKTFYSIVILLIAIQVFAAVEFLSFDASQSGDNVLLEWSTASETQNLGFLLERRTDPDSSWNPLDDFLHNDALLGQGTVTTTTYYTYTDSSVEDGMEYFYRIAGVDEASNIGYLDSVSILIAVTAAAPVFPGDLALSAYPNPFNTSTTVHFHVPGKAEKLSVNIFDIRGVRIATLFEGKNLRPYEHSVQWNAGAFPSGVYLCRMQCTTHTGDVMLSAKKLLLLK